MEDTQDVDDDWAGLRSTVSIKPHSHQHKLVKKLTLPNEQISLKTDVCLVESLDKGQPDDTLSEVF